MPVQAQSTTENDAKMFCAKCKTASLRRRTPGFFNQLTSFYPYTCGRCGNHQKKFRFTVVTLLPILFLLVVLGGSFWLWGNRPAFLTGLGAGTDTSAAAPAPQADQVEALARARTAAGGDLSTFEQMMLRKPRASMDNATVLKLVKASVGKDVILQLIHTSTADYDVSANAIIELKEAGVDQGIILAMINASYATH